MSDTYGLQRPASEQLVDLHVYLLPREVWNDKYRSSFNESISEAQSAGFVRVWPELTVNGLRMVIEEELGHDILPYNYVFLRSVGRCMTQVKPKQEFELKCKAFLPPAAWSPEIVVLEMSPREALASGYSSIDATQSVNGMNHDRMGGPSHLTQQAIREDPYGPGQAVAGGGFPQKSGRPDAYTNSTNEDSGISEPAPEEYDPDFERRNAGADYYNQLPPNHPHQRQFNAQQHSHRPQETSSRVEEQRAEQRRREEEEDERRRKEQECIAEERRIEERRARERAASEERRKEQDKQKHEQRRIDERKTQQKKKEEERRQKEQQRLKEEAERRLEEERQAEIQKREQAKQETELAARMNEEDPMAYDDAISRASTNMETDAHGGRASQGFPTDSQLQSRAEQELRDYEPQSTWPEDQGQGGQGRSSRVQGSQAQSSQGHVSQGHTSQGHTSQVDTSRGHTSEGHGPIGVTPSGHRQRRLSRDSSMETGDEVQQAMQEGLKRVHLTPEVHRKAKIGKVRNGSRADEEDDMYEVDTKMVELIDQLEAARQERQEKEQERENMIKKAKGLQAKTSERRNKARDYWKKRYFDEKKRTIPMEEESTKLRQQLDLMHRKLMSHLEGKKGKNPSVKGPPSKKNDHKIAILKLQHEVEEIKRLVDNARMKLTSEIKLRNQAEQEVRSLKSEVTQKKINLTLTRNQKMAALKLGDSKGMSKTPTGLPGPKTGPLPPSAKTL